MSKTEKIFIGCILSMFGVFGFMNFELAVDANNKSTAAQAQITELEHKIEVLEFHLSHSSDTIVLNLNNYIEFDKK